jgi:hypothetical protein
MRLVVFVLFQRRLILSIARKGKISHPCALYCTLALIFRLTHIFKPIMGQRDEIFFFCVIIVI